MSDLNWRRSQPRRDFSNNGIILVWRVALVMYMTIPLSVFVLVGDWRFGVLALLMIKAAVRPFRYTVRYMVGCVVQSFLPCTSALLQYRGAVL